jgi:hypothetical protein
MPPTTGRQGHGKKTTTNLKTTKHTIEFSNNTRKTGNPATILCGIGSVNLHDRRPSKTAVEWLTWALLYSLDLGSQTRQVLHEQRVAAIDVKDVVDLGVAIGDKPRQHQPGAGPDV